MHVFRAFSTVHAASASLCGALLLVSIACGANPSSPSDSSGPPGTGGSSSSGVQLADDFGGRRLFPDDNWWNLDISTRRSIRSRTRTLATSVAAGRRIRISVHRRTGSIHRRRRRSGSRADHLHRVRQRKRQRVRRRARLSDSAAAATQPNYIEGAVPGGGSSGDRHLLVVDRDRWLLFELFAAHWNTGAQRWEAGSGAVFNLASNARRPEGWTSADAAGLAILPGLVRYDEVLVGRSGTRCA
jgi:hypothetical protein